MKVKEIQTFLTSLNSYANNMIFDDEGDIASYDKEKFEQNVAFVEVNDKIFEDMNKRVKLHRISFLDLYKNPKKANFYVKMDKRIFPITSYSDFNQIFISKQNGYIFKENIRNAFLKLIYELGNTEPDVFYSETSFLFVFNINNHIYKLEQVEK